MYDLHSLSSLESIKPCSALCEMARVEIVNIIQSIIQTSSLLYNCLVMEDKLISQ